MAGQAGTGWLEEASCKCGALVLGQGGQLPLLCRGHAWVRWAPRPAGCMARSGSIGGKGGRVEDDKRSFLYTLSVYHIPLAIFVLSHNHQGQAV